MHLTSYENMLRFIIKYLKNEEKLSILDVGSRDDGRGNYKNLFNNPNWTYIGMDIIQGNNVDIVVKNIYDWQEFKPESFDVVISGQTLEHIEYPWLTMKEIARILKINGLCCIIVPSAGYEHPSPLDCYRFFPDGMKALAKYVGLKTLECLSIQQDIWKDTIFIAKKMVN